MKKKRKTRIEKEREKFFARTEASIRLFKEADSLIKPGMTTGELIKALAFYDEKNLYDHSVAAVYDLFRYYTAQMGIWPEHYINDHCEIENPLWQCKENKSWQYLYENGENTINEQS